MQPVEIRSDGRTLSGNVFLPPDTGAGARPAVLFLHGLGSSQQGYLARAAQLTERLGAVCLTFDMSGHGAGATFHSLTPRDHLQDARNAHAALVGQPGVDPGRVGVCGASYGAYIAIHLTGVVPVSRLALRAPGMYADASFDEPLAAGRRSLVAEPSAADRTRLAAFAGPVLIVESGADEAIPAAVCDAYRRDRPDATHVLIPGATHRLTEPSWDAQFMTALLSFFTGL